MRFTEEEANQLIDKYILEIKEKFIKDVKEEFFKLANVEYKNYDKLKDVNFLNSVFEVSIFMNLLKEDFNYVYEKSIEYWSNQIIKEINNIVDFEKLSAE